MFRLFLTATIVIGIGVTCSGLSAQAVMIPITNHSFETTNVTGNTLGSTPTGWLGADANTSGASGIVYTIDKAHTNVTPPAPADGTDQMAMTRYDSILYQVLTTKIAANTLYTLTVDAAKRNANDIVPTGSGVRLGTGSVAGSNLLSPSTVTTPVLSDTSWATWQSTFTTGATVPDAFIRVEIYWPRTDTDGDPQGLFDNVRLDATPIVPEPASLALCVAGLVLIACPRRR